MSENKTEFQPSSGYRYLVLVSGIIIALFIGLLYTWSLFVKPMCEYYGWSVDSVAVMGNVMVAALCVGSFTGGQLLPVLGAKKCGLIGTIMYGGFMFISSFVTSPVLMYITWGIIAGVGSGILYNSMMFVIASWFPDKRGIIMGIFLGTFGLSTTIMSKPVSSLLAAIGVKYTVMLLGGVYFVVLMLIVIFIMRDPPAGWKPEGYVPKEISAETKAVSRAEGLKTSSFWMFCIAQLLLCIPYNFISSYVTVFVTDVKALTPEFAVTVVASLGIGQFSGRLICGVLADKLGDKPTFAIACGASIVGCIVLLFAQSSAAVLIMFFLLAFGYGGRTPVYGTLCVNNFGAKSGSIFVGLSAVVSTITCLLSGVITASIRAATGSFNGAFYVAIAAAVIGLALLLAMPKVKPVDKL